MCLKALPAKANSCWIIKIFFSVQTWCFSVCIVYIYIWILDIYNSAKIFSMKFSTLLNVKIGKKTKLQNEYYKLTSVQNFQTTFLITFDSFKDTYAIMNIIKNFCSQAATRKRLSKRYGDFFDPAVTISFRSRKPLSWRFLAFQGASFL